uniref:Putative neuraminidase n=1 Tax=viral metagenome TaxID=1070528 RepID=A0A6M3J2G8_9ZZZZ
MTDSQQTGFGRAFLQENGAGPGNAYVYQGCASIGGFTDPRGSVSPIRCPSASEYDVFDVVGSLKGEAALPTTSLLARLEPRSRMLRIRCPFDLQAHYGRCTTPSDFRQWTQLIHFEQAQFSQLSGGALTALDETARATVDITGEITAQRIWYADPMLIAEVAEDEATDEIIAVAMDPRVMCGECGIPSDGTQRMYALVKRAVGTSPGLPAELLVSDDGGVTWDEYQIDTLAYDEDPSGMALVGSYVAVVSNDSGSLHYAPLTDLTDWTEVTVGFEVAGPPNAIFALNATAVWIVGDGGYIYFTEDISAGVVVQQAGGASDLYDVHAYSADDVLACGASAMHYTANGGATWTDPGALPSVSAFRACWMRGDLIWMVGDAAGGLYYSLDAGETWHEAAFPGSGTGTVYDIVFSLHPGSPFGFMAHTPTVGRGRVLRTIDGGHSWHQLPEGLTQIPDNDRITCVAACRDPNVMLAGGLGPAGDDGILLVGS